jgi:hypothetical protein
MNDDVIAASLGTPAVEDFAAQDFSCVHPAPNRRSILPDIPSAPTNVTTIMVAERVAAKLAA